MPIMQTFWKWLVLTGSFNTIDIIMMKSTINFLKDKNAASGIIVIQYEDSMLLRHMKNEYGNILISIDLLRCFLPCQ